MFCTHGRGVGLEKTESLLRRQRYQKRRSSDLHLAPTSVGRDRCFWFLGWLLLFAAVTRRWLFWLEEIFHWTSTRSKNRRDAMR